MDFAPSIRRQLDGVAGQVIEPKLSLPLLMNNDVKPVYRILDV